MDLRYCLLTAIEARTSRGALLSHAEADEKTINRWLIGGMVGKLVRLTPTSPITVEPCPAHEHGRWGVEVRT